MIRIPSPCSENPSNFTPTGKGGFCTSCQKEVLDFREMSNTEVHDFLRKTSGKTCGIFRPSQLEVQEVPTRKVSFPGLWAFGFLGFLGLAIPADAQNSTTIKMEQELLQTGQNAKPVNSTPPKKSIRGQVISFYFNDKQDLPGALVQLKGQKIGVSTDLDGYFELEIPDSLIRQKNSLIISFIGFKVKEVTFYDTQLPLQLGEIELQEDESILLGEVIYIRPTLWQKAKGIFRKKEKASCGDKSHQHG